MKSGMSLILTVLSIFYALAQSSAADQTDPYAIMNAYYAAIGGLENVKKQYNTYYEGNISIENGRIKGALRQWNALGGRYREEVDLQTATLVNASNGRITWQIDAYGKLSANKDENTIWERQVREHFDAYEHLDPQSKIFKVKLEGLRKVGKSECYYVVISNTINPLVREDYYDVTSGLLLKTVMIKADRQVHTVYSDYRPVEGVKYPFRQETEIMPLRQKQQLQIKKIAVNGMVDKAFFDPPNNIGEDYRFINNSSALNIPLTVIDNKLFVKVSVKGNERLWYINPNDNETTLDAAYLSELNIIHEEIIRGADEKSRPATYTVIPSMQLPGVVLEDIKILIDDVNTLYKERFGVELGGILGADFLKRFITKIDYPNLKLSLYNPTSYKYEGKGIIFDTYLEENKFVVPLILDDTYEGRWLLDLTYTDFYMNYPYAVKENIVQLPGADMIWKTNKEEIPARQVRFKKLLIGGMTITNPVFITPQQQINDLSVRRRLSGVLGYSFLKRFTLVLNYVDQQITMALTDTTEVPYVVDKSGLQLNVNANKQIEVLAVTASSPAQKAKFQVGDILLSVNGIKCEVFDSIEAIRTIFKQDDDTKLVVEVMSGGKQKKLKLKLKEYF